MIANYGYEDGSGTYLITIDTEKCDGCGKCVEACPSGVLEVVPNEFDPFTEKMVVAVTEEHRKKIRYSCAPCKPYLASLVGVSKVSTREMKNLPCVQACQAEAISHSW